MTTKREKLEAEGHTRALAARRSDEQFAQGFKAARRRRKLTTEEKLASASTPAMGRHSYAADSEAWEARKKTERVEAMGHAPDGTPEANARVARRFNEIVLENARKNYDEVIREAAKTLRRCADELEQRYSAKALTQPNVKPMQAASWVFTFLSGLQGNMRLDLIVSHAADFADALRALKQGQPRDEAPQAQGEALAAILKLTQDRRPARDEERLDRAEDALAAIRGEAQRALQQEG
jgi:hypothetical protein